LTALSAVPRAVSIPYEAFWRPFFARRDRGFLIAASPELSYVLSTNSLSRFACPLLVAQRLFYSFPLLIHDTSRNKIAASCR
jgi:hypothetical protein